MKTCVHLYNWTLLKMRNISNKIEEIKTYLTAFLIQPPPPQSWHSWGNVEYYVRRHKGHTW
jgi:hypothetical protein